jgi:hypothetical protein
MADVTNEMLYEELLKLDARMERLVATMEETVEFARETSRELAAGQAKIEATKRRLFGNRFDRPDAAE